MKTLKLLIGFALSAVLLTSCYKEDIKPQQPLSPQPIITDSTLVDTTLSLAGQTWVIKKVLNTDFDDDLRSDTLIFIDVINLFAIVNFLATVAIFIIAIAHFLVVVVSI